MPFWGLFVKKKSAKMQFQTLKMGAISQGQGRPRSKFADKVPLTTSNVTPKFRWNNQNRFGEVQKCDLFLFYNNK